MRHSRALELIACCLVLGAVAPVEIQAEGYRLRPDRVEVRIRSHWRAWRFPADVVEISPTGTVAPRYLVGSVDAVLDAPTFTYEISPKQRAQYDNAFEDEKRVQVRGGIKRAGSRPAQAPRVLDGDPATFWEPDRSDPVASWWVEIDLGRLVSATRLVVRFAEEGEGARSDPFLQFRVHAATGQSPFGAGDQSGAFDYTLVGETTRPNRDQRVFAFDLAPLIKHTEGWTGQVLQYVRIAATASNGDRAEAVTEEAYAALSTADRGAIEHVWQTVGGERVVTPERYGALPVAQQGGIRYYRRERPRLAGVEVWTVGENISLGLLERGGSLHDVNPDASPEKAFDGSMRSDWYAKVYDDSGDLAEWGLLTVDLGALFWVDGVRFVTRVLAESFAIKPIYGYLLRGSDGSTAPDGSLIWEVLSVEESLRNADGKRRLEEHFEIRKLRFLEFRNLRVDIISSTGYRGTQGVVTEMQIYGQGHPPAVVLTSDLIDLGAGKSLTTLTWEAETPPGTAVEIRTRSGDDLREVHYYFKKDGTQLATQEDYEGLPSFFRGEIVTEFLPGPGWSNWSQVYQQPGEGVHSPSPRRYLMLQVKLLSEERETAARLRSIEVHFSAPVVDRVVGEIAPQREVPAGQEVDFALFIRPSYGTRNPGIDRIRLLAPSRSALSLERLSLGGQAELAAETAEGFTRQSDGGFANAAGERLTLAGEGTDSLVIGLPHTLRRGGAELVQLSFRTRVFQSGSTFQVAVGNAAQPAVWQQVDPGEAVDASLGAGRGLTVLTPMGGRSVRVLGVPGLFTPNGDGINDAAAFAFSVLKVNVEREVVVEIFDLVGRKVRQLVERRGMANGLYRMVWDGRDEAGSLVLPGLYLARIRVDSDTGEDDTVQQVVGVAY